MFPSSAGRAVFVLAATVLLSGGTAEAQETVKLQLHRPAVPGDRFSVESTAFMTRSMKIESGGENETRSDKLEVEYEGEHQVLECAPNGTPTRMALTVAKLVTDDGSGKQSQFPAGTRIIAQGAKGGCKFLLGEEELEGTLLEAFALAGAGVNAPGELTDDEIFPSGGPRKPGDSWSADARALRTTTENGYDMRLSSRGTKGTITFDALESLDGVNCARLTLDSTLRPLTMPGLPAETSLLKGLVTGTTVLTLPLDSSLPPVEARAHVKTSLSAGAKNEVTLQIETDRTGRMKIRKL